MNKSLAIESTNQIINYLKKKGIAQLYAEDDSIFDNTLQIDGQNLVNFGSCSYLGLEFDRSMQQKSVEIIRAYGTQFSASRAYVSAKMYKELEEKLERIFGGYVVVMPTTTLGHIATIPVVIGKNDAVIMDHQVHLSVQTAAKLAKSDGAHVELLRHNRMDLLEARIEELSKKYENIWYLADGIYSMYGDNAPMKEIERLLHSYESFHFYVDDAHGMSCFGEHGRGYALSEIDLHKRMVVGTSLNKAFASGGGAFIFPTKEMAQKVRNCGGPLITSGPMQPAALGAALAAADIHLSEKIYKYQETLYENIRYMNLLLEQHKLPNLAEKDSPIFFIGVGLPKVGYNLVSRMFDAGFLVNIGIFPAVPMKNTGVRFTLTRLHTFQQIEKMVHSLAENFTQALVEEDYSLREIYRAFKIKTAEELKIEKEIQEIMVPAKLNVEVLHSITDVRQEEWNNCLGDRGIFDWNGLNFLENSFKENNRPEDNWDFNYIIVRDEKGEIVLSTFTTSGIMKDDMLSDPVISRDIELYRLNDPYFYTSKFLSVGSLVTEGDHLYLNKSHKDWKAAMDLFFSTIDELQQRYDATTLIIRDMSNKSSEMDDLMVDNGFFKVKMPKNYDLDLSAWEENQEFLETLSKRSKKHFKQNVRRFIDKYIVETPESFTKEELKELYQLYANVQRKGMEINTHILPYSLFENMVDNNQWDITRLKLKANEDTGLPQEKAVGAIFAYKGAGTFIGAMVGIDYEYNRKFGVYRQAIYQYILRARELGYYKLNFGFCAGIEKKKFGATEHSYCAYMQVKDHFVQEALSIDSLEMEARLAEL